MKTYNLSLKIYYHVIKNTSAYYRALGQVVKKKKFEKFKKINLHPHETLRDNLKRASIFLFCRANPNFSTKEIRDRWKRVIDASCRRCVDQKT